MNLFKQIVLIILLHEAGPATAQICQVLPTSVPSPSHTINPTTSTVTCSSCVPQTTGPVPDQYVFTIQNCRRVICNGNNACKDVRIRNSDYVECRGSANANNAACQGRPPFPISPSTSLPDASIQTKCLFCAGASSCQLPGQPNPLRYTYNTVDATTNIVALYPTAPGFPGYILTSGH